MEKKIMINDRLILNVQANEFWYKTRTKDKHYTIQKTEHLLAKLLEILAENAGSVIHREAFISKIWYGNDNVGNPALTKAVSKLRKLLHEIPGQQKDIIETIPKKGYRLNAEVQIVRSEASLPEAKNRSYSRLRKIVVLTGLILVYLLIKLSLSGGIHQMMHHAGH